MWYSKMKIMASVFLAVALAGSGVGLAVRQAWAGAGADEGAAPPADLVPVNAQFPGGKKAGGKGAASGADVAELRREVEILRRDLETALKEINDLKAGVRLPAAPPEKGPFYRGRPARFWQEQLKDGDESYRLDAVIALGVLAQQQKSLVPVLVNALKDEGYQVRRMASNALGKMGLEVVPVLIDVLKDKTAASAYSGAIDALARIDADPKVTLPLLIQILQNKNTSSWRSTISALFAMGPEAKPAIPALVEALGHSVQLFKDTKNKGKDFKSNFRSALPTLIANTLVSIEPDIRIILNPELGRFLEGGSYSDDGVRKLLAQFQKLHEDLKKKYPPMEK